MSRMRYPNCRLQRLPLPCSDLLWIKGLEKVKCLYEKFFCLPFCLGNNQGICHWMGCCKISIIIRLCLGLPSLTSSHKNFIIFAINKFLLPIIHDQHFISCLTLLVFVRPKPE